MTPPRTFGDIGDVALIGPPKGARPPISPGIRARRDPPRTRQSPLILAAFRPWGGSQGDATRGVCPHCRGSRSRLRRTAGLLQVPVGAPPAWAKPRVRAHGRGTCAGSETVLCRNDPSSAMDDHGEAPSLPYWDRAQLPHGDRAETGQGRYCLERSSRRAAEGLWEGRPEAHEVTASTSGSYPGRGVDSTFASTEATSMDTNSSVRVVATGARQRQSLTPPGATTLSPGTLGTTPLAS
jgi:hypothetical protein